MTLRILFIMVFIVGVPLLSHAQKFNKQASLVDLKEINEITIFHPSTWIEVIEEGFNEVYMNPSSKISAKLNLELLDIWKGVFQSAHFFAEEQIPDLGKFSLELREMADKAAKDIPLEDIRITPALYQMMAYSETKYSMLIHHEGYVKGKNFRQENVIPISINGDLIEDISPIPLTNLSSLYIFIVDHQLGHAVFGKKVEFSEVHPLRKKNLAKQYKYLFKDFY